MKTITVTQSMAALVKNDGKKYSPAYEEYMRKLPRKSKLPQGKYFRGRIAGAVIPIMDEFWKSASAQTDIQLFQTMYKQARRY
ncbi:hypothetical protein [Morganella morganii]|uniref:Uncharacterized protein n=1 Tax=Morganella morganii TaxID=582 RepID=A0A6B7PVN5_MORMO|nr:hypothetical protein [Morganella morganii]HBT7313565.1 hypothetical protein [Klebsiella pneumoniae]EKW8501143.1 hypothetical protein [Morganella morganii]ELB1544641.1 hypothetical protein [Morganella morganii]MBS9572209.1 hypothetical protein [Morganella morganii subsp. morganii]MBS9585575.1 hypothetical protein [Morganella morganii subsp. morganii]